ncbi:hypothetical protein [Catellatospora sp. NPDC049609]|uniref:hypothetical protein n=1 Tax=Catellatospora sp. NPDC049609 TaxID=3155505 RepID=UPI0034369E0E
MAALEVGSWIAGIAGTLIAFFSLLITLRTLRTTDRPSAGSRSRGAAVSPGELPASGSKAPGAVLTACVLSLLLALVLGVNGFITATNRDIVAAFAVATSGEGSTDHWFSRDGFTLRIFVICVLSLAVAAACSLLAYFLARGSRAARIVGVTTMSTVGLGCCCAGAGTFSVYPSTAGLPAWWVAKDVVTFALFATIPLLITLLLLLPSTSRFIQARAEGRG